MKASHLLFAVLSTVAFAGLVLAQGSHVGLSDRDPTRGSGLSTLSQQPSPGVQPLGTPGVSEVTLPQPPTVPPMPQATSQPRTQQSRPGVNRSEIPAPPTASASQPPTTGRAGGWVTGQAALEGGPFPAYMTGLGVQQMTSNFGMASASPANRPFADYSRPASVSPYLNLYRPEGALGQAGNYYSLVRPMVEQQQRNRQLSQQIRRLESAAQPGGGYTGRAASGGGYFMNHYGFFPGLGGR